MMAGPAVMYAATTALTFVVAIAAMATINWQLTLLALLPLPPITLTARYSGRAIHERFERIQAQLSDLSAVTQEALAGVRVVRAYRQEARELERFRAANLEYVGSQPRADPLAGTVLSEHGLVHGRRRAARAVARKPRRDCRPDERRRARRVQRLSRHARVADDCLRLGHEPRAARPRLVGADAGNPGHGSGDRRPARGVSGGRRRTIFAATSLSTT